MTPIAVVAAVRARLTQHHGVLIQRVCLIERADEPNIVLTFPPLHRAVPLLRQPNNIDE
jgi:hypothetical protein